MISDVKQPRLLPVVFYVQLVSALLWSGSSATAQPLAAPTNCGVPDAIGVGKNGRLVARELILGNPFATALNARGELFVVDASDARLIKLGADGSTLWVTGRRGQGPGEFANPYRVAADRDGGAIVFDLGSAALHYVDSSGRFVRRARLPISFRNIDNILGLPTGGLAVSGFTQSARYGNHSVHLFDSNLHHVRSIAPLPEVLHKSKLAQWGVGGLSLAADGSLLFTRRYPYQVYRFAPNGDTVPRHRVRTLADVTTPDDAVNVQGASNRLTYSIAQGATTPLRAVQAGPDRVVAGRASPGRVILDVLDEGGNLVASVRRPAEWRSVIGFSGATGTLWLIGEMNDEPVILRCELEGAAAGPAAGSEVKRNRSFERAGVRRLIEGT
jgi:hypothetical protein